MTVKQLALKLNSLKPELQDKDIKIVYPNGVIGTFDIKFVLKDPFCIDKTKDNVDYIIFE